MQKLQAQNIVKQTLQNDFDKERFTYFIKNLLNKVDGSKAFHARGYVPEAYKSFIKTYERLATYTDPTGNKIDILVVYLQKEASLERARTAQRNFVARYLKDRDQKDAGLIAFVSPDPADWRFSLVTMEYKFTQNKSGKTKVKEEFTPARRWSFLVGKNENSHTAQSRLAPIVEDDQTNPTLKQLEDAFNIEKVTKEFFEKYRELFLRVHETLLNVIKNHPNIKADFAEKNVNTIDFSKKLLGQIVFLYFLQKKGWFGVPMNKSWGDGDKKFLRTLFKEASKEGINYFNDYLEPLFYEALAKERDEDFYSRFNCKIPFLNGGLFDPISNYDWVNTAIDLPNDIFSNTRKTKDGDTGDGILDIFDRYNFTVKEDEPLEREVAIDPEMLGKVFENLLEVKDRKSKGTYYTPREIVNYMCEQSLVNYLATELEGKVAQEDLEKLIKIGENVVEHEAVSVTKEDDPEYGGDYKRLLPDTIKDFASEIDEKLVTIKVCDPAIGSGAFPVGMMNAIVKARMVLSSYIKGRNRTLYAFKRDCIQNSLYGVDIDPGAVEIAKLRLWLSLVVDEDDIQQIKPLPNLDYKIMQGNSLLEEFEGIKLFDEKLITTPDTSKEQQLELLKQKQAILQKEYFELHSKNKLTPAKQAELNSELKKLSSQVKKLNQPEKRDAENASLFDKYSEAKKKADDLKRLHKEFFEMTQKSKKDNIKKQIEQLEWELIEATLKEQNKISSLKKLEEFKRSNTKPFFLWKLNFADVFENNCGFDLVIGNPPYLRIQGLQDSQAESIPLYKQNYESARGSFDLYALFIERGYQFLSNNGQLVYIVPNKFFQASFGKKLREIITSKKALNRVVKFGAEQVFENPTTYTCLLFLSARPRNHFKFVEVKSISNLAETMRAIIDDRESQDVMSTTLPAPSGDEWNFQAGKAGSVLQTLNKQPQKLGDVVEKIFQGIATSADKIYVLKVIKVNDNTIRLHSTSLQEDVEIEKGLLRPFLMGKDVHRYQVPAPKNYVLFPYLITGGKAELMSKTYLQEHYPHGWLYLSKHRKALEEREGGRFKNEWWCFSRPQNMTLYEKTKIMTPEIALGGQMTYDEIGVAHTTKVYSFVFKKDLQEDQKYWLGLLNSKVLWFFLSNTGYILRGGYFTFKTNYLTPFPVRRIDFNKQKDKNLHDKVVNLVNTILQGKKNNRDFDSLKHEEQIDKMVYELYGLTDEEIEIVESPK